MERRRSVEELLRQLHHIAHMSEDVHHQRQIRLARPVRGHHRGTEAHRRAYVWHHPQDRRSFRQVLDDGRNRDARGHAHYRFLFALDEGRDLLEDRRHVPGLDRDYEQVAFFSSLLVRQGGLDPVPFGEAFQLLFASVADREVEVFGGREPGDERTPDFARPDDAYPLQG